MEKPLEAPSTEVSHSSHRPDAETTIDAPKLRHLTPEFDEVAHGSYVDHLIAALDRPAVRNVAVTGRYGSGKSSVLRGFADHDTVKGRVLFLALSSLGPGGDNTQDAPSTTNRIERSSSNNFFTTNAPVATRSRYRRTEAINLRRAVPRAVSQAIGSLVTLSAVLWLLGKDLVPDRLTDSPLSAIAAGLITVIGTTALFFFAAAVLRTRVVGVGLSTSIATLTLSEDGRSYFDEYFDEIIYFFDEIREIDVVVFEDLDRFDDPGIFEQLRELNTLLNGTRQLVEKKQIRDKAKRKSNRKGEDDKRTIRFVYALRDSVFEQLGDHHRPQPNPIHGNDAARLEVVRANRTKFFDLVIPVVPFITHRNARDLLNELLSECDSTLTAAPELIDLIARHLPDMRTLRNLANEYDIFGHWLLVEKQGTALLSPDQLLAMIAYKTVHLGDFERILLGTSQLDDLYRSTRTLIGDAIDDNDRELGFLERDDAIADAVSAQSEQWGKRLILLVNREVKARSRPIQSFLIGTQTFTEDACEEAAFWIAVQEAEPQQVTIRLGQPSQSPVAVVVTAKELEALFGDEIGEEWERHAKRDEDRRRGEIEADTEQLKTSDFAQLAARDDDTGTAFGELLDRHCGSDLARELLVGGHIDRNFTLYVAEYYGVRVTPNVLNFIVRHVDTNTPDHFYSFAGDDELAALVREARAGFLGEPCSFNDDLLDYLLTVDRTEAATVLRAAAAVERASGGFVATYLMHGQRTHAGVAILAPTWGGAFRSIASVEFKDPGERVELLDVALAHSAKPTEYDIPSNVATLLQEHALQFPTLVQDSPTPTYESVDSPMPSEAIANTIRTLESAGVVFDDIGPLSDYARQVIAKTGCHEVNAAILRDIVEDPRTPPLDALAADYPIVYERVLKNSAAYVEALGEPIQDSEEESAVRQWSVLDRNALASILDDAENAEVVLADLDDIIALSHPASAVEKLTDTPTRAWPALVKYQRANPSLANVDAFITAHGVTKDLSSLLLSEDGVDMPDEKPPANSAEHEELVAAQGRVISAILGATDLLDPEDRIRIVQTLSPPEPLPLEWIDPEEGNLLAGLIEAQLCADDLATFQHFAPLAPDATVAAARESSNMPTFIAPNLLGTDSLRALLTADGTSEVQRAILERHQQFFPASTSPSDLVAAGEAAIAIDVAPTPPLLQQIAVGTTDERLVPRLLSTFEQNYTTQQTLSALATLGGPYARLSASGSDVDLPYSAGLESVMRRLRADQHLSYRKSRGKKNVLKITVA